LVIMEHRAGKLVWRTYDDGRHKVVPASLQENLGWWCDYLESQRFRITAACSGRAGRVR
jgi:hypothetical protein